MGCTPEAFALLEHAISQVEGARWKKMFGEAAVYYDERVVALFADDRFYLRMTEACDGRHWETGAPYPGAHDHWVVTSKTWTDPEVLAEILAATASATPAPKPKKPKKPTS